MDKNSVNVFVSKLTAIFRRYFLSCIIVSGSYVPCLYYQENANKFDKKWHVSSYSDNLKVMP